MSLKREFKGLVLIPLSRLLASTVNKVPALMCVAFAALKASLERDLPELFSTG